VITLDEGDAMRLIAQVSDSRGVPLPREVRFRYGLVAYVHHGHGGFIHIPTVRFLNTHQAIDTDEEYRLLLLHEMAHFMSDSRTGHAPRFYALLFSLCEEFGVDLAFALADERSYKPRNAPKGYQMYLASKEVVI